MERPHLVDHEAVFLGMEVFTEENDMSVFYLVTRWADADFYRNGMQAKLTTSRTATFPMG